MALGTAPPLISALFIMAFAAPSFYSCIQTWRGRGVLALCLLGVFALAFETLAIKTGFPYGYFSYGPHIGFKLWNAVPWTVFFAWTPLVLGTSTVARTWMDSRVGAVVVSAALLVLCDMVLDPVAVALKFWLWQVDGFYYHVPWTNFAGWFLSGLIGSALAVRLLPAEGRLPQGLVASLRISLFFWVLSAMFLQLWVPVFLGLVLNLIIWRYR